MARIRTVKLDLWTHEDLSALPIETHVLAAALLNYADDEGYFNANAKLITATIFPLRELSSTVPVMLHELSSIGYLRLFSGTDGKQYGHVCKFLEHQVISHAKTSKIKVLEDSSNVPVSVQKITAGKEGNGKEGNGSQFQDRSMNLADSDCGILICQTLSFSGIKLPRETAEAIPTIRTTLGFVDNWQVFDFLPAKWKTYQESTQAKYRMKFETWLSNAKWKDGETPRVNGQLPKEETPYERMQRQLREPLEAS